MIDLEHVGLLTTDFQPPRLRQPSIARPILQDISIQLQDQQVIGLVGPTGVGKSSLLKLLNRLIDPSQGQLYWQGQPYKQFPVAQLRRQIMLVPQEPRLLAMTVAESMVYGLKLGGQTAAQLQSALPLWQERLQIPSDWLGQREQALSLGQRQWVTIARGIACEPPVLLLDEPTAYLDQHYRGHLNRALSQLRARSTQLVLIASHDWQWLESICDRVLYLHQGRLTQNVVAQDCDWAALGKQLQSDSEAIAQEWL